MITITEKYEWAKNIPSDINEHIPVLKEYADKCDVILELGVRAVVSTWAFLKSLEENNSEGRKLISNDLVKYPQVDEALQSAKDANLDFTFIEGSDLDVELPECDFCFLDTWHTEEQMEAEMKIVPQKVRKYLAFHDTETFAISGEDQRPGIWKPIQNFVTENPNWTIEYKTARNNGLTIIRRN